MKTNQAIAFDSSVVRRLAGLLTITVLLPSCGGGSHGSTAPTLVSIAVTPATASVPNGLTQQFKATGTLSDSSTKDLTSSVFWNSSATGTATVDSSGLAHALAPGSASISASSGAVSGSATLTVTAAVLQSMAITPSPASTAVGRPTQLKATGTNSDGTTLDLTTQASWSSSTPSVATVASATGIVTGVASGSTTITATMGSVSATAPLTIGPPKWHSAAANNTPLIGNTPFIRFTMTLLASGKVLITGGEQTLPYGYLSYASAELYDPASDTWSIAASMKTPRTHHTATLLSSGSVLVAGGLNIDLSLNASAELYDPQADAWSSAGQLAIARSHHTATLLPNGKVLVVGGDTGANDDLGGTPVAQAELYDPTTNTWSAAAMPATARTFHTAALLPNGKVLIAGGYDPGKGVVGSNGYVPPQTFSSAELYDPVANTWSAAAPLATARTNHTATLLSDGRVLVAGGDARGGQFLGDFPLASVEIYDPTMNTWSTAAMLNTARIQHSATLLLDGRVLVAGGRYFGAGASPELYDPATNAWSAAPEMINPRYNHSAIRLPNGDVLVMGGVDDRSEVALASTERYW